MSDLSRAVWRKASRSTTNGGCVEIAANLPGVVAVRDSKRPEGGAHVVSRPGSTSGMQTRIWTASFSNPGNSFSKMSE